MVQLIRLLLPLMVQLFLDGLHLFVLLVPDVQFFNQGLPLLEIALELLDFVDACSHIQLEFSELMVCYSITLYF